MYYKRCVHPYHTLCKIPKFHLNSWCRKGAVAVECQAIPPKLSKTAFPQNFHTRKLGEISIFYAVMEIQLRLIEPIIILRYCMSVVYLVQINIFI